MGRWTLESVTGTTSPYVSETVGHNVVVTYKLRYEPSMMDTFTELPILQWNEQIYMIEHHKGEWWEFEANMYQHNPLSKTLEVWAKRYIAAYDAAKGTPFFGKGSAKLLTKQGAPVPGSALGTANTETEKADAVRRYLKKNGGRLEIVVHDIPSINKPDSATHKERLLVFDCGFAGGGGRYKGTQYLDMNGGVPAAQWITDFQVGAGPLLAQKFQQSTMGLRKVPAPPLVANPRAPMFASGECW